MLATQAQTPVKTEKILGLIAGDGKLPAILAQSAREKGYRVVALALSENARTLIAPHADVHYLIAPGQLGRNIKLMKDNKCSNAVLVGKVPKLNVLRNLTKFDWTAIKEISSLPNLSDDAIQSKVGEVIEAQGIKILTQSEFLRHLFPDVGVLTKRQPTTEEYADIEYGLKMAKAVVGLDIGQTVIVSNRMIVAIEAIEGTDEAIRRAVQLARGPVVVVKVAKPNQDQRFDIPTVGLNTLDAMKSGKPGGVLAIEANATMMVERSEMAAAADAAGIAMVAVAF